MQQPTDAPGDEWKFIYLPAVLKGFVAETPPFTIGLIPELIHDSVPAQRCVFLVIVADLEGTDEPVQITGTAPRATVSVEPGTLVTGQVGELTVVPDESSVDEALTVTVQGTRGGVSRTATATLQVQEGHAMPDGELAELAAEIRGEFVPWIAENHPDLGITADTEWESVVVRPHIMVVMYHLFFSEEWEMGVQWHVTIPPYVWTRIYLRHRFNETQPSYAFEISSRTAGGDPIPIDPPGSIWR